MCTPWNWSWRWLLAAMCVLGIKCGPCRRAAVTPKFWAISLAPKFILFLRFSIRFSFFIFIVCLHVCEHTCTLVCGGQKSVSKSPLLCTPLIWSRASQSTPELAVTASLPSQLALRVLCLCLPRLELHVTVGPRRHLCEFWGSELWACGIHSKRFNPWSFSPACDGGFLRVIKASSPGS